VEEEEEQGSRLPAEALGRFVIVKFLFVDFCPLFLGCLCIVCSGGEVAEVVLNVCTLGSYVR